MPDELEHPFNPGDNTLPDDEQIPAKIWELLRRNSEFKQAVERLRSLDLKAHETKRSGSEWKESSRLIADLENPNPLAALALQWLVPEPEFFATREHDGLIEDGTGHSPGFNHASWIWVKRNVKQGAIGPSQRRGPEIASHYFEDWKNWQEGEALFNFETAWPNLPKSFQSAFRNTWENKYDCADAKEIAFADAWKSFRGLLSRTQKQLDAANKSLCAKPEPAIEIGNDLSFREVPQFPPPGMNDEESEQFFALTESTGNYRIFAVPMTLLTKLDADKCLEHLRALLSDNLLERRSHFFGTKAAWRDFIAVESRAPGETEDSAIRRHILQVHENKDLRDARKEVESAETPEKLVKAKQELRNVETNVLQSHSSDVRDNLDCIQKLSALIFPEFSLVKLLRAKKELLNS